MRAYRRGSPRRPLHVARPVLFACPSFSSPGTIQPSSYLHRNLSDGCVMSRPGIQISFPGVSPKVANRLVQELQQDLASDPALKGVTSEVVKPDPNTQDLGTMLAVFGQEMGFWATAGVHTIGATAGHVVGAGLLAAFFALLAKKSAKEGVTPTVTPVNAPPEAEKAVAELKAKHGVK